ncbi:adenosine deaminase [Vibrio sp. ZSDE26]|uniref:Adenine deaminase n=1 Tax=Vibrio amylolyticus TaxID=2847292 RepID=A0A9X1XHG3_9VIBR|nr:adenosine deaminase [Vibrio amylolyticus]MCK6261793.1 adenosine deaminase [Vibrio amylolyticus]
MDQQSFIQNLPKIELHMHIEGSLEPEMMFELSKRNNISLPFHSPEEVRKAYEFDDLQSFLDIYYQGANVLIHEKDFYDLTWAYLLRCKQDNVIHTEIFFDPQTHLERGIDFGVVVGGIDRALTDGKKKLGISSQLIMCFLRHLDEESAFETLAQSLPYKDKIIGVGLDSSELGHPPEKFQRVFDESLKHGYKTVAHAGEEGPASNITNALVLLNISRIDHGVRCVEDSVLVNQLIESRMPLTVCPLSNVKLKVFESMEQHNIVELLKKGLCVTVNSDDPAYFGGYMNDNFNAIARSLYVTNEQLAQFSFNAVEASFVDDIHKTEMKTQITDYLVQSGVI